MNCIMSDGIEINNGIVKIDGEEIKFPHKIKGNISNTIIGGKIYLNGYELDRKHKTWKRTLKSLFHYWF